MSIIPNYVPSSYKTVTPKIFVKNAEKALEFYNRAFGAETEMKLSDDSGRIVHAEFKLADTIIMLAEEDPGLNKAPTSVGSVSVVLQLYVPDVEGFFEEALRAGAEEVFPIASQFYGDRAGRLRDPFGHEWIIATHEEDVPFRELEKRFHQLTGQ